LRNSLAGADVICFTIPYGSQSVARTCHGSITKTGHITKSDRVWEWKLATLGTSSPSNPPRDSITFNDQSQSLIQAGTVFQPQFAWASDVPTGTAVLGQSAQITSNSLDNRALVSNHGKDHAQYDAPNNVVMGVAKFVSMTSS